jgi:hypothetical protein
MDLDKRYQDSDGIPHDIMEMVRLETGWAASRIQEGEKAIEALKECRRFNKLQNDLEAYLFYMAEWALNNKMKPDPKNYGVRKD